MSENGVEIQKQKPQFYKPSIFSPVAVVFGIFVLMLSAILASRIENNQFVQYLGTSLFVFFAMVGFIWGLVADRKICKSNGMLTGRLVAILGIVGALLMFLSCLIRTF